MTNLKKEEQEISVEHNTSGTFAPILSLDFKFQNNCRKKKNRKCKYFKCTSTVYIIQRIKFFHT